MVLRKISLPQTQTLKHLLQHTLHIFLLVHMPHCVDVLCDQHCQHTFPQRTHRAEGCLKFKRDKEKEEIFNSDDLDDNKTGSSSGLHCPLPPVTKGSKPSNPTSNRDSNSTNSDFSTSFFNALDPRRSSSKPTWLGCWCGWWQSNQVPL